MQIIMLRVRKKGSGHISELIWKHQGERKRQEARN
jgi:hypothetical protein